MSSHRDKFRIITPGWYAYDVEIMEEKLKYSQEAAENLKSKAEDLHFHVCNHCKALRCCSDQCNARFSFQDCDDCYKNLYNLVKEESTYIPSRFNKL